MFLENYAILRPLVKSFIQERFWIYDFDDTLHEVIGMFCCAPSLVRKDSVFERINKIISDKQLPLEIEERDGLQFTHSFTIRLKK